MLFQVVQGFTGFYRVVHGCTRMHKILLFYAMLYKILKGCTRLYKVVQIFVETLLYAAERKNPPGLREVFVLF